jgi:hypothetical protein
VPANKQRAHSQVFRKDLAGAFEERGLIEARPPEQRTGDAGGGLDELIGVFEVDPDHDRGVMPVG